MLGEVRDFDDHRGYGTLGGDDGASYFFHCTCIADGSRTIEPGARVSFLVVPGHTGRMEAAEVEKL